MTLGVAWALDWMRGAAARVEHHKDELVELDRQIGDGDHGANLARGLATVVARLEELSSPPALVSDVLRVAATTVMSTVGGASGPLYGTAFLRAARVTARPELDPQGLVAMLEACVDGAHQRGGAVVGDKTMVDALAPAAEAAARAAAEGADVVGVLRAASLAARAGAESTAGLTAVKGRASYLGERSVGVADPGAVSSALVVEAAYEAAAAAMRRAA